MKKLTLTTLAFFAFLAPAQANHSWSNYHWARTSNPFTLKLGNNLTGDWANYLAVASGDWNSPASRGYNGSQMVFTSIVSGAAGTNCTPVAGTTQVCNKLYGSNGWLGLATVWLNSSGHISQGTAKMNDTYFTKGTYNNPNEKLHVMCQEVAHSFGLGHQSTSGASLNTCMDYYMNAGINATSTLSTKPNAHDYEQLNTIYSTHKDTSTSVAQIASPAPTASKPSVTDDPRTWGRLVHQSANGLHSEYVRKEFDGTTAITEVIWTPETAAVCPSCDHRTHAPGDVK